MRRKDDARLGVNSEALPVRSTRYFQLHNYWYVATREGASLGPFDTKEKAAQTIEDYIGFMQHAPHSALELLQTDRRVALH